jgi:hypothetical protein
MARSTPRPVCNQAPINKKDSVSPRTNDLTNPNGWQAWPGRAPTNQFPSRLSKRFTRSGVVHPSMRGRRHSFLDTNAQTFIVTFARHRRDDAVYYITTKSLANPSWSDAVPILDTQGLVTEPKGGPWVDFNGANYPSMIESFQRFQFRVQQQREAVALQRRPGPLCRPSPRQQKRPLSGSATNHP